MKIMSAILFSESRLDYKKIYFESYEEDLTSLLSHSSEEQLRNSIVRDQRLSIPRSI